MSPARVLCYSVLFAVAWRHSHASKILLVSAPVISHMLELRDLGLSLAAAGHDVWMVVRSDFPRRSLVAPPPLRVAQFEADIEDSKYWTDMADNVMAISAGDTNSSLQDLRVDIVHFIQHNCKLMLADTDLVSRLEELSFDIAIVNTAMISTCVYALPYRLHLPFVTLSTTISSWFARIPILPSAVPFPVMKLPCRMSFQQRMRNFALYAYFEFKDYNVVKSESDTELVSKWGIDGSWMKIARQSVLFIVTVDHILGWPEPALPNVIRIPPFGARDARPLPADLQSLVSEAPGDIAVVSFGSIAGKMPQVTMRRFFAAFSRIPLTFLWRFHESSFAPPTDLPRNVHLLPWLPQNDLLGHVRTKLFVTHCGNGGQYEAAYHGVPMVGFPLFADQHANGLRMQHKHFGIVLDINSFTADELVEAINEVLTNETYKAAVSHASAILRDRPINSLQTATYWVEHVLKFGGEHLRSYAQDMPWYQFFMLDVLIFFVALAALILAILVCMLIMICKCVMRKSNFKKYKRS